MSEPLTENTGLPEPPAYRMLVGNPEWYDIQSANQFNLMTTLGLREHHSLLEIGCGSLRVGRLFIPYLLPGQYYGLELQSWLVDEGIKNEIGQSIIELKKPTFSFDKEFTLSIFERKFDFLLAHSIFSHTPEFELRRCMQEAAKVMTPTSIFAATYWPGKVSSTSKSWMVRAEFRPEHMQEIIEDAGLVYHPIEWLQHDLQHWFLVLHKDHEVNLPQMGDAARVDYLQEQLQLTEQQLISIRNHPWVRLGHKLRYFVVWMKLLRRLGEHRNSSIRKFLAMRIDYTRKRIADWFGAQPDKDEHSDR